MNPNPPVQTPAALQVRGAPCRRLQVGEAMVPDRFHAGPRGRAGKGRPQVEGPQPGREALGLSVRPGGVGRCVPVGTVLDAVSEPVVSQQDAVLTAVSAWEAQNLRALQEQEARALQEQEQEQLLTYTREDAYNAVRTHRASPQTHALSPLRGFRFHVAFPSGCSEVPEGTKVLAA